MVQRYIVGAGLGNGGRATVGRVAGAGRGVTLVLSHRESGRGSVAHEQRQFRISRFPSRDRVHLLLQ